MYTRHVRRQLTDMRAVTAEDLANFPTDVTISDEAVALGSPKIGDYIAVNPNDNTIKELVEANDYLANFHVLEATTYGGPLNPDVVTWPERPKENTNNN